MKVTSDGDLSATLLNVNYNPQYHQLLSLASSCQSTMQAQTLFVLEPIPDLSIPLFTATSHFTSEVPLDH